LVTVAKNVFDQYMRTPNQIQSAPCVAGASISEADLLRLPQIPRGIAITHSGLVHGIGIVLAYTEAWLRGVGCIPLHNAMEDAATAEISRAQIWQWRHLGVSTEDDNRLISAERIGDLIHEEVSQHLQRNQNGQWLLAGRLVEQMLTKPQLDDFLTSVCYPHIVSTTGSKL
jgi:malate synthase